MFSKKALTAPLLLPLLLLLGQKAHGEDTHISTASALIDFSKAVSSGALSFYGTTVFLDADIVFSGGLSEQFVPIGSNSNNFQGTFN